MKRFVGYMRLDFLVRSHVNALAPEGAPLARRGAPLRRLVGSGRPEFDLDWVVGAYCAIL